MLVGIAHCNLMPHAKTLGKELFYGCIVCITNQRTSSTRDKPEHKVSAQLKREGVALSLPVLGRHSRHGSEYSVANKYYGLMVVIEIRLPTEHTEGDTNTDIGSNEYTLQAIPVKTG